MAYEKTPWSNGATPLSAENMNHIENGLETLETDLQTGLAAKVDKVTGKGLSTNDYTTAEKTKLAGIAAGAEVNQNAFSNVRVEHEDIGLTAILYADSKTDTLTVVAGTNMALSPDSSNDKLTINCTITNATTSKAGLMSASDKTKLNGMSNFVAGTYVYDGSSTAEISFTDNNLKGKSLIIAGVQDSGNPILRASLTSSTGKVKVYLSDPVTIMRVNYIAW